jgi:hypothetical protein
VPTHLGELCSTTATEAHARIGHDPQLFHRRALFFDCSRHALTAFGESLSFVIAVLRSVIARFERVAARLETVRRERFFRGSPSVCFACKSTALVTAGTAPRSCPRGTRLIARSH